jgi:hypothetical protein
LTELENMNSTTVDENAASKVDVADETFSTLAHRTTTSSAAENGRSFDKTAATAFGSLDDSGEFTMPHGADVSK